MTLLSCPEGLGNCWVTKRNREDFHYAPPILSRSDPHLKRERDREALQTSPSPPPPTGVPTVWGGGLPAGVGDWSLQGQYAVVGKLLLKSS